MWAYFLTSNPDFFRKNSEIQPYVNYIKNEAPDILYLTEICGAEQCDSIRESLERMGYKTHTIKGFELWNMQDASHRYLYHIMGAKWDFTHNSTIQQYTTNPLIRFMKRKNSLWKWTTTRNEQVSAILDGWGSRYTIGDTEIGLLHAHATDTTDVFEWIASGLGQSKRVIQVLMGDVNMKTSSSDRIVELSNLHLKRVETKKTHPYYFSQSWWWIFTQAIYSLMQKNLLSHPDQIFINSWVQVMSQKTLWPNETGLKSDHAVNHLIYRTTSQS